MKLFSLVSISAFAITATALEESVQLAARVSKVVQFPNGTWLESLGCRQNGKLIFALIDRPEVWEVDPKNPAPRLVYQFPNATRTSGIVEILPDVFAVTVGNVPGLAISGGTWAMATMDFNSPDVKVKIVAPNIPGAQFLNGLTLLSPRSVLASDSAVGGVYRIDIDTGKSEVVLKDKTMAPVLIPLGVNGVHALKGYLYYSNTVQSKLARIPIDNSSGAPAGSAEVLYNASDYFGADDFALSADGQTAFATVQLSNSIFSIDLTKKRMNRKKIVSGSAIVGGLVGPTSVVFDRLDSRGKRLYVSTNNGAISFALGTLLATPMEGGSLFAVELD